MLVDTNPDLLKTIHSDEFLPPIHLWARLGGLCLVGTVGVVIALIAVIPYRVVVKAPATVRPVGEIRVVQAEAEGVVAQIAVTENQVVKQGDVIAYLDDSRSQTQQSQLRDNLQQNQQQLAQRNVVRATATGTILKLALRNPGQVVHLGELLAEISPSQSTLIVKARVTPQEISLIEICKQKRVLDCQAGRVHLRLSAYPYPDYGTLKGAVVAIAPDTTTAQNIPNGLPGTYYEVTIQPENSFLVKGDGQRPVGDHRTYKLQAGMEATAEIITKQETVLSFLLRKARLLLDN